MAGTTDGKFSLRWRKHQRASDHHRDGKKCTGKSIKTHTYRSVVFHLVSCHLKCIPIDLPNQFLYIEAVHSQRGQKLVLVKCPFAARSFSVQVNLNPYSKRLKQKKKKKRLNKNVILITKCTVRATALNNADKVHTNKYRRSFFLKCNLICPIADSSAGVPTGRGSTQQEAAAFQPSQ